MDIGKPQRVIVVEPIRRPVPSPSPVPERRNPSAPPREPVHRVLGRVSLWGTIVEHELGWRAEVAYPAELFIPSRRLHGPPASGLEQLLESLSDYGVPVSILDAGARGPLARRLAAAAA